MHPEGCTEINLKKINPRGKGVSWRVKAKNWSWSIALRNEQALLTAQQGAELEVGRDLVSQGLNESVAASRTPRGVSVHGQSRCRSPAHCCDLL